MRYIPHTKTDIAEMLEKIGASSVEELFEQIPKPLRFQGEMDLPAPMSEAQLTDHLMRISDVPAVCKTSFLGAGAYHHHVSMAADQLLLRSEFYTAYTPYQPEVSQGTTQAVFEFQTMICRVLGMAVSNASMYDGATAAVEAAFMCRRVTKRERIVVSAALHPEYIETIQTYLRAVDNDNPKMTIVPIDSDTGTTDHKALAQAMGDDVACVIAGYPNFFGVIERVDQMAKICNDAGARMVTATWEPYAFGVVAPPGAMGVDVAVGEGQSLGVPISFGGPGIGLFSIKDDKKLLRQMPGRLAGKTVDADGNEGYVLTLSTREQHIRREKATSNICSNHGLMALAVGIHLSLLGKIGFEELSSSCLARAEYLKAGISNAPGFSLRYTGPTFNEFAVRVEDGKAADILEKLDAAGILGGVNLGRFDPSMDDTILVAVTETITREQLDAFLAVLS